MRFQLGCYNEMMMMDHTMCPAVSLTKMMRNTIWPPWYIYGYTNLAPWDMLTFCNSWLNRLGSCVPNSYRMIHMDVWSVD